MSEADQEKARAMYDSWFADGDRDDEIVADIARALADERQKAEERAYNEGAADALYGATAELMDHETVPVSYLRAESDRIRRASGETE